MSDTFSLATFGNGIVAIVSGLVADQVANNYGYVSPFMVALAMLVTGSVIVSTTWNENYGDTSVDVTGTFQNALNDLKNGKIQSVQVAKNRRSCCFIGSHSILV